MRDQQRGRFEYLLYPIVAVVGFVLLWTAFVMAFSLPVYLLPSPYRVVSVLLAEPAYFVRHTMTTVAEALVGLVIAIVVALSMASALAYSDRLRQGLLPLIIASQTIPIVAIAPVLAIWFGVSFASKALMAAILCWFPLVMNATRGLTEVPPALLTIFSIYRASKTQVFLKLRFPSGVSQVIAGARISAGLAMIGAIVAEYVGADQGIGYVITQASYRLETDRLFAAVICGAIAGVVLAETVYNLALRVLNLFLHRSARIS